jgi:hypothetical protein
MLRDIERRRRVEKKGMHPLVLSNKFIALVVCPAPASSTTTDMLPLWSHQSQGDQRRGQRFGAHE